MTVDELVARFGLRPHPEGGFFKESHRSVETIGATALPERFGGERSVSTAIYYLLPEGSVSGLHRIKSDEVWHFYAGGPLVVAQIAPDGTVVETILGTDCAKGQMPQHVVPAGHWFGAYPLAGSGLSFVGCTVAPGFDFADLEMGGRAALLEEFPGAKVLIERLAKKP
jgi:predicted cupin superfamily sugar epimerase